MKIYVFHTDNNEKLLREWFLPTLKDDYPVIVKKGEQGGYKGVYKEDGWFYLTTQKIDFVMQAIRENWNEAFIFSDPDIQFFGMISRYLSNIHKKQDMLFQRNSFYKNSRIGDLCTGFFLCVGNAKTLNFWQNVKKLIGQNSMDDQDAANYLLMDYDKLAIRFIRKALDRMHLREWHEQLSRMGLNGYRVKWGYLPREFCSGSTQTRQLWAPGMELPIPENIILHHANWTRGIETKVLQLEYVRDMVNKKYSKRV